MKKKTNPKILMSFCTDWYWYDVAKALINQGVQIQFLISRPPQVRETARRELKHTKVINQDTLELVDYIEQLNNDNPIALSEDVFAKIKDFELEFLMITDRLAFFPITVSRRRYIFKELVRYWYYFLSKNKLDAIFFNDAPHVGFDTALFAVAKTFFHLPFVSMRRPFIRDRMLLVRDYRQFLPNVPSSYQPKAARKKLEAIIGKELLSDVFNENPWQKGDKAISQAIHRKSNLWIELVSRMLRSATPSGIQTYFSSLVQPSRYGGFNYNHTQIQLVEKLCGLYHRYHVRQQRMHYDKLTEHFSWPVKEKYLYFPLHLQPERSTIPEGGVFEDQMLALDILERTLPKGWIIVVKEHPRQFHVFDFQKHTFRSNKYYDDIVRRPSVRLCPMHIAQEELVAKAEVTATITGTGGWESLLIGKPAIVFGNTWYGGCQSAYRVDSVDSARSAFTAMQKKKKSEVELDVLRFLAYYRNRLVVSSNAKVIAQQSQRPYAFLVENMAKAIQKEILSQL